METRDQIEKKVFSYIEEHQMFQAGDKVVAGISGGADSVCLLFLLSEWAKKTPLSIVVVHVNHGIRKEAGEDAAYVERLCRQLELPFFLEKVDVRKLSREQNCSEEEAGRNARYSIFERICKEVGAHKIAVAHNCNDRGETMLFHLFRGSGIKGLGSIRPVRDHIVRPILCLERAEVEAYLKERQLPYCQDATNEKDDYTRNKIRHHILSYVEEEIAPGCVVRMAHTADLLVETEDYLEEQTANAMRRCVEENVIHAEAFLAEHPAIQKRILYEVLASFAGSKRDISAIHIEGILSLLKERTHRRIDLPYGMEAMRQYDRVIFQRKQERATEPLAEWEFTKQELTALEIFLDARSSLRFEVLEKGQVSGDFPQNQYTKWLDYDKIEQSLVVRTRKVGDYMTIAGKDGRIIHKMVKDYMLHEKIPSQERDCIFLLAEGQHIIWLIGYRISEHYKISSNTKRILQVQFSQKS